MKTNIQVFMSSEICFVFVFFPFQFFLAFYFCISPSLSDLPTMKKPRSHTSSQAQWKPSDTLHYVMLVPIKADTICCQSMVIPCRKVTYPCNTRCPGGLSVFGCILCCYKKIHTVRQRSKGWTSKALPVGKCVLGICFHKLSLRPKWETDDLKPLSHNQIDCG